MASSPKPRGRPTDYRDDMPAIVLNLMRQGKSVVQVSSHLDICKDTFYEWVKVHKNFSDAFMLGKTKCESHWEDWLHLNLDNKNVNAGLVKLFFTNRFDWTDKKEQKIDVTARQEDVLNQLG